MSNVVISCKAFVNFFADKILLHYKDLLANLEPVCELEATLLSSGLTLDQVC